MSVSEPPGNPSSADEPTLNELAQERAHQQRRDPSPWFLLDAISPWTSDGPERNTTSSSWEYISDGAARSELASSAGLDPRHLVLHSASEEPSSHASGLNQAPQATPQGSSSTHGTRSRVSDVRSNDSTGPANVEAALAPDPATSVLLSRPLEDLPMPSSMNLAMWDWDNMYPGDGLAADSYQTDFANPMFAGQDLVLDSGGPAPDWVFDNPHLPVKTAAEPVPTAPVLERSQSSRLDNPAEQAGRSVPHAPAPALTLRSIMPKPSNEPLKPDALSGRQKRKRGPFNPNEREIVKTVRRLGACIRCRAWKEKCDENTPCKNCKDKADSSTIFKQPCSRAKLSTVVVYRLSNTNLGQVRASYPKLAWSGDDTILYDINIRHSRKCNPPSPVFTVGCRIFIPKPQDTTTLGWNSGGKVKEVDLPPLAIFDIKPAQDALKQFLDRCQPEFESMTAGSTDDEILALTLVEARRYADAYGNNALDNALRTRCIAKQEIELMESSFNIPTIDDPYFMHPGYRPFPVYLLYQLDLSINLALDAHKKQVLKRLNTLVFSSNPIKVWFEVFLEVYLLLSTITASYANQLKFLDHMTGTNWFAGVDFVSTLMIEEWEYSAETILAHFRCVIRGHVPFSSSLAKQTEAVDRANLDPESRIYIMRVVQILQRKGTSPDETDTNYRSRGPPDWLSMLFQGDEQVC